MNLKEKVRQSLKKSDFPDFNFIYSTEVLEQAPELLDGFLREEKQQFEDTLALADEDIHFDSFESFSALEVFWAYLEHYKSVSNNDTIRKIIEDFEPKLMEFSNEVSYNKRYFEMYEYCLNHVALDPEQAKIISETVKNYKIK
jgi:Zn-dependent oligopeptidase